MLIRNYQVSDAKAVIDVYKNAIMEIASQAYDRKQIEIWSSYPKDIDQFTKRLSMGITLVAVDGNKVAAFGQLNPANHIDLLFTAKDYSRQGYATAIYQQLEDEALKQGVSCLYTEASIISKYFFIKQGFTIIEPETVLLRGVGFERFRMEKVM
ncbi:MULTISPECIES: GNAT family N-acetyltransferase [Moorena]|uniref:GNAT family acetyltransferase n=1 Tax=Moorena producens 3L TaxID=489825 RepID=F4XJX0_9CYAN|nr:MULTISPECIES: GNAT family N-acetyltransferase [Moorena]EGJ34929.1 GNAT family acetyltransferase [Moorena producens 3L]NEP67662.1 GNAT family N-acetyltransferase [Moorena sp. SIO3A5]NEQ11893.1 GNAT family N-acetyltransferase [Moorena sp. SIO4E2]NET67414.1 GNAT family N-acetyltransferase [Moorena sp. SIO1G6]OLT65406.1 GNAT family N-acetyltransferase [Moorena producens 3L]